jgi:hypothetical protein
VVGGDVREPVPGRDQHQSGDLLALLRDRRRRDAGAQ